MSAGPARKHASQAKGPSYVFHQVWPLLSPLDSDLKFDSTQGQALVTGFHGSHPGSVLE